MKAGGSVNRSDKVFTYTLAVLIGIMVALVWLAADGARAEAAPSPDASGFYRLDSNAMQVSLFPPSMTILDVVMVDIDPEKVAQQDYITAFVYFPYTPGEGIEGVALFDGYHLAQSWWARDGNALRLTFFSADLRKFDSTVGLYLVLLVNQQN